MLRDSPSHAAALTDDWEGLGVRWLSCERQVSIAHAGADVNDSKCWNELVRLRLPKCSPRGKAAHDGDIRNRSAG